MSRARRRTVKGLVILGSVFALLSVFAIWIERQALNTDDWVDTSGRMIENGEIRSAVSKYLVDQLYENVDIEKEVEDILPEGVQDLAGPVSGGLRQVGSTGAEKLLETSTAQNLWKDANRAAHEQLLAVLENKKEAVETTEGDVTLNLGGLVTNLADQVGIGQKLAENLPPDAGQVTILRSDELKTAQDIAVAIKGLALLLSLLTLLSMGLAVYLSRESRWVTVLFCGVGLVGAAFAVIVFREIVGGIVVDQLVKEQSVKPAAEDAWAIATSLMVSIATTVIAIGILAGIAGWLASPTGSARATRLTLAPVLRDYIGYVYAGLAVLVCIYFLTAPTQNLRSFLTTLVIAGFIAIGIHELRKQTAEEFPGVRLEDTFGTTRTRVVEAVRGVNIAERVEKLRLPEMRRGGAGAGVEAPPPTAEPPPGVAPPGAAPGAPAVTIPVPEEDARLARLERLGQLRDSGVLTEEEFEAEKARVLADEQPA